MARAAGALRTTSHVYGLCISPRAPEPPPLRITHTHYALRIFLFVLAKTDDCLANVLATRSLVLLQYESQLSNLRIYVRCMMAPPRTASSEGVVLIPAIRKDSTTGYKGVSFHRSKKQFVARARDGGKDVSLGSFDTADEAATAYARSEYGHADAAKLLQPRAAPTADGLEAIRQAEREGLTLATSGNNSTGYKGVTFCPKEQGRKKYKLQAWDGGKNISLGMFATAEQAALFSARREAGRDTAPPPLSSTSAELPVYELSILTPEQMAAVPTYSPSSNLDYSRARRRGVWRQAHDYAAALALGALAAAPTYGSPSQS